SYDQKHLQLSGNRHKNIGHKRFFSTSAASIASNYIIPPADLPRACARPGYSQNRMRLGQSRQQKKEMTMRKMIYLVGTVAIAVVAAGYVWSQSTQIASPQRAMATAAASMISPTEMMTLYKRPLPVEQFPEINSGVAPIPPSEAIYR